MAFRSYLIRTERLTILVDACVGNDKERPVRPNWHRQNWPWMDNLRAQGVNRKRSTSSCVPILRWNTKLENGRWVDVSQCQLPVPQDKYEYWEEEHKTGLGPILDSVLPVVDAGKRRW